MTNASQHAGATNNLLLWDRLLEIQTELFLPHELAFLFADPRWGAATSVLDVGCGNGYYLSRLAGYFPGKRFWGIDCSASMISIAEERRYGGLRFQTADFYEFRPDESFDVLLLRLVLQHLRGIEHAITRAAELLRPGGALIVLEPDPTAFLMKPEVPSFTRLLGRIEQAARSKGTNRAHLSGLHARLAALPEWGIDAQRRSILPASSLAQRAKFQQMFLLWIDILEQEGQITFPFDRVRSEIETWAAAENAYGQVGFQILALSQTSKVKLATGAERAA